MVTFEELYGEWSAADAAAKEAEAKVAAAYQAYPFVPPHLHNEAIALRGIANRLLDQTMARMREDAQPRAPVWRWRHAAA